MPKEVTTYQDIKEVTIIVEENGFTAVYGPNYYNPGVKPKRHVFGTWDDLVTHLFENLDAPEECGGVYA